MSKNKKIAGVAIFLALSITFAVNVYSKISLLDSAVNILKTESKPVINLGSGGGTASSGGGGITSVTNDTNVTGTVSGSTLTLGWTGTLADSRVSDVLTVDTTTGSSTFGNILNVGKTLNAQNIILQGTCTGCGGAPSGTDGQTTWYSGTTLTATSSPFIVTTTGHIGWGTTTPTLAPYTFDNGSVTGCEYNLGNQTGTITVNWSLCNQQIMVLTGDNVTINFLNERPGNNLTLIVCQDGTGARTITTWDSKIKWSGVATSTQTGRNGTCDAFSFRSSRGTTTLQDFHTGTSKEL